MLSSITGKRVFPAFSHAFWCILQLVIHEKPNNLWSIHTRITWSIFPDIFSSSVASVGKLGHPWHLNNASCKQARDMRSLCSHINTPQSSSQTPSTKFCRQKKIFSTRGRIYDFGCWMSFTRQASGRLLRRGIEGWPHCPLAFWTVTLWRLSTHTYTWSKLKPLWPIAQAQYDPFFNTSTIFVARSTSGWGQLPLSSCP